MWTTVLTTLLASGISLVGVWLGFQLSRRAAERDRRTERLFAIYVEIERLRNLLTAHKRSLIEPNVFHRLWARSTEKVLAALLGAGLSKSEIKRVLSAINERWEDPKSESVLRELADDLLERLDTEYSEAAKQLLDELGKKPEDIDPIVFGSKG
jgi:hypothetical protein